MLPRRFSAKGGRRRSSELQPRRSFTQNNTTASVAAVTYSYSYHGSPTAQPRSTLPAIEAARVPGVHEVEYPDWLVQTPKAKPHRQTLF